MPNMKSMKSLNDNINNRLAPIIDRMKPARVRVESVFLTFPSSVRPMLKHFWNVKKLLISFIVGSKRSK